MKVNFKTGLIVIVLIVETLSLAACTCLSANQDDELSVMTEAVRIIVVGDTEGNGINPGCDTIVPQLIADIVARDPDFVLFPGDLVGKGSIQTFHDWKQVTAPLAKRRYMVPGNHDLPGRSATNEDWQAIFDWLPDSQEVPNITATDPVDTIKGIDKMDYFIDLTPSIRLISVATDRDAFPDESHTHSDGYEIIGGEPKALDWFQSVMALESTRNMDHVFVMTHHSITAQMSELHSPHKLTKGTPTVWWKSIAGTYKEYNLAAADAVFTGHTHSYIPNHPDPHSHTAEVIVGTGGGSTVVGATPQRRVHGFMEVVIDNGIVSTAFYGDSNGDVDGWSFTELLDTFLIADNGIVPQGELALYRFDAAEPGKDSSLSSLSKNITLNFNEGATAVKDRVLRGNVLALDGNAYLDSKSLGDHVFQVLGDLRIQLLAKADGPLGHEPLDNVLVAFGDADGVATDFTWQDMLNEEIANYAYILSYTAHGYLQMTWEYYDDPDAHAPVETVQLVSTEAVMDPTQWHQIEVLRDAETHRVRFLVDGTALGRDIAFRNLPTGAGAGSLYIGALPNTTPGNEGGVATFSGKLDDVQISSIFPPVIPQSVGPMVGEVSSGEARFLYRGYDEESDYLLSVFGPNQLLAGTSVASSLAINDYVAKFHITGLSPETAYTYQLEEIFADGATIVIAGPGGDCHFKTFPDSGVPAVVTAAFVSGVNTSTSPVWERMGLLGIDQLYLMGDTPYIDSADLTTIRQKHRELLKDPFLAALGRHTPVVGTWDDHDFGLNNSNGVSFAYGKPNTRRGFVEYRAHDQFGTGTEGVYNKVDHGPIEVFLLDPRWFSQTGPSPVDPSQTTCFGPAQWDWLLSSLRHSQATFKVLAMGQIWQDKKNSETDDMFTYWYERDALLNMIRDERIPGVVLLGGDIHVSRYLVHPQRTGYDIHDFITSPGHTSVIPSLNVYHPSLEWSLVQGRQFLTLIADTTKADPTLTARYITHDGTVQKEVVLTYSDLRPRIGKGLGEELRAWWPFEGDFNNQSVLGLRIDAVPKNGASLVENGGLRGGAASFTCRDSEYLLVPRSILHDNSAAHTVSLWCKPFSLPAHGSTERHFLLESTAEGFVSTTGAWSLSLGFGAFGEREPAGKVNLQLYTYTLQPAASTGAAPTAASSGSYNTAFDRSLFLANWNHVVFTFDSQKLRLYVNGSFVSEHPLPVPGPSSEHGGLVIGGHRAGTGRNFDGLIDEFAIWSRVLSDTEITALYGGGTPSILPVEAVE